MQQKAGATPSKWPHSNQALPNSKLAQENPKSLQGKRRRLAIRAVSGNNLVPMVAQYFEGIYLWDGVSVANGYGDTVDCTPDMLQAIHLLLRRYDYCSYGKSLLIVKLAPGSPTLGEFVQRRMRIALRRQFQ